MHSDQLGHIICEQLREEPLAVLPGFGAFVRDRVGASLDEQRGRIEPPHHTVIFNVRLTHNDGLLMAAVAQKMELSYADADTWITEAITELRSRLSAGETVTLEGLGELSLSAEGAIGFKAVQTPNVQNLFFGLRPTSVQLVEKDNVDKVRELVGSDGSVVMKMRTLPLKRIASYAAAAVAVGFMMWIPIQRGGLPNSSSLVQELNPFAAVSETTYAPRSFDENWLPKGFETTRKRISSSDGNRMNLSLTEGTSKTVFIRNEATTNVEDVPLEHTPSSTTTSYKVIAATFATRSEAADRVAKMIKRGFAAEYAGQDAQGHMVAYGTYSSLEDAEATLRSVQLSNKEARIVSGN